jgi:hypothetical protein
VFTYVFATEDHPVIVVVQGEGQAYHGAMGLVLEKRCAVPGYLGFRTRMEERSDEHAVVQVASGHAHYQVGVRKFRGQWVVVEGAVGTVVVN